jgi:hypothetical protein
MLHPVTEALEAGIGVRGEIISAYVSQHEVFKFKNKEP